MRKTWVMGVIGLAGLILAGCGGEGGGRLANTGRPELLALLQLGRPVLDCREACLDEWHRVQPDAARLDASGQWSDLAVLVMRTGYQDDLSVYYLGRAAEGLGFYVAAASYYRQSVPLSGTAIACANLSRLCGGVALPAAATMRLAAIERKLAPAKPRRARPLAPAAPPATPEPSEAPPAAEVSPPAPPPPPAPAPTPVGASPERSFEYIEPPPARQ